MIKRGSIFEYQAQITLQMTVTLSVLVSGPSWGSLPDVTYRVWPILSQSPRAPCLDTSAQCLRYPKSTLISSFEGFHSGVTENSNLLDMRCFIARLNCFRRLEWTCCFHFQELNTWTWRRKSVFKTSGTTYPARKRHMPEDRNPRALHCLVSKASTACPSDKISIRIKMAHWWNNTDKDKLYDSAINLSHCHSV
jgi:hypothetical protein